MANIETAPEFKLPDYKGLPANRPKVEITDKNVEDALNHLREGRAEYKEQDRTIKDGDYINVSFTGTIDEKPITEFSETASFWLPTLFSKVVVDKLFMPIKFFICVLIKGWGPIIFIKCIKIPFKWCIFRIKTPFTKIIY